MMRPSGTCSGGRSINLPPTLWTDRGRRKPRPPTAEVPSMTKRTRCLALFELAFRGLGLVVGCVVRCVAWREREKVPVSARCDAFAIRILGFRLERWRAGSDLSLQGETKDGVFNMRPTSTNRNLSSDTLRLPAQILCIVKK